jgi:TRAP-type transport system small permease protein
MNRISFLLPVRRLFATGSVISLAGMITAVAIQVFSRFFLDATPHWTEEAARIFFIYSVAFGTGTGIVRGDFIRLDLIGKHLSPQNERVLHIFTESVIVLFSIILIIYSLDFVRLGMDEKSPALQITMGLVFFSMVIIGMAIFIFTMESLYRYLREEKRK